MNSVARMLDLLVERIEQSSSLDRVADRVAGLGRKLFSAGPVRDVASGTPIGHPLHPALVVVPVGAWLSAGYLDVAGSGHSATAAQRLVGLGVLAAVPVATTGISDWLDTEGAERRVGLVHWALNSVGVAAYAGSWLARRRGHHTVGVGLALGGAAVIGAAGWFGGHLAYALGVGVDTTAFLQLPSDWTDVAAAEDLPTGRPVRVSAAGTAVLLVRDETGISALVDRCTHRGAPLDEGFIEGDCIVCPWHGSKFTTRDGTVQRGPATRPQPVLDVQETGGRVQVRRTGEQRTLRINPVGP
jgi:nitrite reductase/ring-hydroxylating ferredoxin subunit/uncharacterized membrane protein